MVDRESLGRLAKHSREGSIFQRCLPGEMSFLRETHPLLAVVAHVPLSHGHLYCLPPKPAKTMGHKARQMALFSF